MKKANVDKIEVMMGDFLQYRYCIYLRSKELREDKDGASPNYVYYRGACAMIESCGGTWHRNFHGDENKPEDLDNPKMYSHTVILPNDDTCARLNVDAWK